MSLLHPDRLFPADRETRAIAREIYGAISGLPIISPHGHCDPAWFARNAAFADPTSLLLQPDHYVLRMLISQGLRYEDLGIAPNGAAAAGADMRTVWRRLADNYHLFRGTPTRLWLDYTFETLFGLQRPLGPETADLYYDTISACLARPDFRPRALFDRFGIEMLATTESALDPLAEHAAIRGSGWAGNVITTYRPDAVIDPAHPDFAQNLDALGTLTGCDTASWQGYLQAHQARRAAFRAAGAVATDHGTPDARTADLPLADCTALLNRVRAGAASPDDAAMFRAQTLTEMARMSAEDGMVMQIHPGAHRNHNAAVFARFGPDRGFDIPRAVNFVDGLAPLLNAVGDAPGLRVVVFTLDETTLSRELAPLAGAYPALYLGPAWWFLDAPDAILRFREAVTETAGFYNTVGFNDDTRAFPSVPARHDMARRLDAVFLARRVADHRLLVDEAHEIAQALTVDLPRRTYSIAKEPE